MEDDKLQRVLDDVEAINHKFDEFQTKYEHRLTVLETQFSQFRFWIMPLMSIVTLLLGLVVGMKL